MEDVLEPNSSFDTMTIGSNVNHTAHKNASKRRYKKVEKLSELTEDNVS
jgi:hypothetical protein